MKLTVDAKALRNAFKQSIARGSTMPIMMHDLLIASNDQLSIYSRDTDHQLMISIPATVEQDGSCTIDAKQCRGVLAGLNSDVSMHIGSSTVFIDQGRRHYRFNYFQSDEWSMLGHQDMQSLELSTDVLADAIDRCGSAMDVGGPKPALNGLYISQDVIAGASSYYGAIYTLPKPLPEPVSIIIPSKVVPDIRKLLADDSAQLLICKNDDFISQLSVKTNTHQLTTLLVQARYPYILNIIPSVERFKKRATLNTTEVLGSISRLINIGWEIGEKMTTSPLYIAQSDDGVVLKNKRGEEVLESTKFGGLEDSELIVQATFLREILNASGTDEIYWHNNANLEIQMITPSEKDSPVRYGLMPVSR